MVWILLALLAHLGNALVFVVDKSLLGSGGAISQPLRYTFYSAMLAGAAIILLPLAFVAPTPFVISWSAVAGIAHLAALWLFFSALKAGEPSRVVPITGSTVPLFTVLFALTALGEVFSSQQWLAVVLLIAGGALLSIRFGRHSVALRRSVLLAVLAGAFFAAYFAVMKFVYSTSHQPFLAVFMYSRLTEAALAVVLLGPLLLRKKEAAGLIRFQSKQSLAIGTVFVGNKVLAAGAFLLQHYAINLGSVTIVNALQGTQYVFVLLLAAAVSAWFPSFFREQMRRVALVPKVVGIVLIASGLTWLV